MTRDEFPQEIQSLIAQCEANVARFTNDQMSAALHFAESLALAQNPPDSPLTVESAELAALRAEVEGLRKLLREAREDWYYDMPNPSDEAIQTKAAIDAAIAAGEGR